MHPSGVAIQQYLQAVLKDEILGWNEGVFKFLTQAEGRVAHQPVHVFTPRHK
jgi:hypothetical protein